MEMRNIYIFDIIKIRKSALFVSIIGTFFIGYILFYVISFIGAEKILEEMPAELLDIHEKELGIIVVSLNPSISFLTMMKTGIAYAIPLVISIPFSLLHSNEWELKTIKILTSYKNKMNIFFKQMSISIFLTYLLVVITAYLNKVLSVLMWNKLIHKYGVLKDSHIINVGLKTYVMLLLIVLLTAVMYFSLGYILTYSFGTSIPFVVAILGNSIAYTGTSGRRFRKHPDTKPDASGHFAG
jgi:hypothetical protein